MVEEYVGISGLPENDPMLPDSKFHPAMGFNCSEVHVRNVLKKTYNRTLTIGRAANITKPINGRAACHYCGPCERGCMTHSYFNSAFTTVADALKTGKCTLIQNAMVYQVLMDATGKKARGVSYVDRQTRQLREVQRPRRDPRGAGARVGPHPAQQPLGRTRQQQRRARQVPDGSHLGRRWRHRGVSRPRAEAAARTARIARTART